MAARTAPTRVIIDTDPGIDDTAAIFFALASPDEIRIECFTTVFGNCSVEKATRNCLALLDVAGRADLPVYRGAERPLLRDPRFAPHIHGDDGLGGHAASYPPGRDATPGRAIQQLIERVMAEPGEIETSGTFTFGQTVADWRGQYAREPNATVLLDVDHARLVDLFAERVVRVGR